MLDQVNLVATLPTLARNAVIETISCIWKANMTRDEKSA